MVRAMVLLRRPVGVAAGGRRGRGLWASDAVPAVLRPACWWALLIGAPPARTL
jgi:hypothetical protein